MDVKDSIQRQFGQVAANYATSTLHTMGADLDAMVAAATLQGSERVLDAGCGAGHTALRFAERAREVVAVDLTEPMLAQARRLALERGIANITFRVGDVEQLEFPAETFDIVTSRYSAHHYPHPRVALSELRRVLRPSGRLLLIDVVAPEDPAPDTFLNAVELLRDPSHVRDHTSAQWIEMMAEVGLAAAVIGTLPLRLGFESWVARMRTPEAAVAQICSLMADAPREVRSALIIEEDCSFTVPVQLIQAQPDETWRSQSYLSAR